MERVLSEQISEYTKEKLTGNSQHQFTKGKSRLTNLVAF